MKKFAAMALAMVMCLGMASCGDSGSEGGNEKETTKAAETTAAEDKPEETTTTTEETTTTPDPNAIPEGHKEISIQNDLVGVQLTFTTPEFVKWEENDKSNTPAITRIWYRAYYTEEDYVEIQAEVTVMDNGNLDWFEKTNETIPNTEYRGYITGHSNEQDIPMNFYGPDYMDGSMYAHVCVEKMGNDMPADEFNALVEEVQKTVKLTDLGGNQLYADDGSLLNTHGLFKYPTEMTIEDQTVTPEFFVSTRDIKVKAEFTDKDGQAVKVKESGYGNNSAWESFMESNEKNSPYECKIAGYDAKGYIFQELENLTGRYTVKIDDETFIELAVIFKGDLDISALKNMMEGVEERDELNKKMSSYADQFLSAAEKQ